MVQQTAIYDQGCKLMVGVLPFIFRAKGITSRQDAGQNILRSGREVSDMKL